MNTHEEMNQMIQCVASNSLDGIGSQLFSRQFLVSDVSFPFSNGRSSVLTAAAAARLWFLCLVINKRLWIAGEAVSQLSRVRVQAGQRNDWSSGGLKNAVW